MMAENCREPVCRGRQAEARRNDQALLDAARRVFATHGPHAAIRDVAAEAGIGLGSLYRRYAGKEALLQQLCRDSLAQQITAAERALAGDMDPWHALACFIRTCVSFRAGAFTAVAGTIPVTPELRAAAREAHELVERLVNRAWQAGSLRLDASSVDIHRLIELFSRRGTDDEAYQRLLALALDGLRAAGREPLPGSQPTWDAYARRWQRD
jgi:AcrR family transcriptional regulator